MIDTKITSATYRARAHAHAAQLAWLRRSLIAILLAALIGLVVLMLWLGQLIGAILLPLFGLAGYALLVHERRARVLARRIAAGQLGEKIEVRGGAWGDLDRAVNDMMQAQRMQQRIQEVLPAPLPAPALQGLLFGDVAESPEPRMLAVLLVSIVAPRDERTLQADWLALAQAAQSYASEHMALLQPCGDAILLAFGAFADRPLGESLRLALGAAEQLQRRWPSHAGAGLSLSLAIGPAQTAVLPGLGYCVLGAPVSEALQILQLSRQMGQYGLVSGESVYYARRQTDGALWQPTSLRIPAPQRGAQVLYTRRADEPPT